MTYVYASSTLLSSSQFSWNNNFVPDFLFTIIKKSIFISVSIFGCAAFELVTGDMLFAPKESNGYGEDEDHLALMMELFRKNA